MKLTIACLCAFFPLANARSREVLPAADFYVAPGGNDAYPGTREKPFASIEHARDAVRPLVASGLDHDVTVLLFGGTYELLNPLEFGCGDSGSERHAITYAAYPGQHVILSGGSRIGSWTKGHGEVWTAPVSAHAGAAWNFRELLVGGMRRQRARLPAVGYFNAVGDIPAGDPAKVKVRADQFKSEWSARGDVEIIILQAWMDTRSEIRALKNLPPAADVTELTEVTLACSQPAGGREENARFWIENAPDSLTAPGQWYLDRTARVVSYWPLPGEDPQRVDIVAPRLTELVRIAGDLATHGVVRNIRFSGLEFQCADWSLGGGANLDIQAAFNTGAAISLAGALNCVFEKCALRNFGGYGMAFGAGCKDNRVLRCDFSSMGAGAVKIGEPTIRHALEETASGNTIADSVIHDIGIIYPGAVGIWIGQSSGNTISHNHIFDTTYTAISVGWTWGYRESAAFGNTIECNLIHDIGRGVQSDMSGIYTLGAQPGTIIRGNVIHDVTRHKYGGWGIYTDEGSSSIVIRDNLVYRTQDTSVHQHYGKDNTFTNNIFASGRNGLVSHSRPDPVTGQFTMIGNILMADDTPIYAAGYASDAKNPAFAADRNLLWNIKGEIIAIKDHGKPLSLVQWHTMGLDTHSIAADPHFADPVHGDFHLAPDSPAAKIGFVPFDPSLAGPRAE